MDNIINNDEILKELAELKEETIAVLEEIESMESEIKFKKEQESRMSLREGFSQLKVFLDEAEKSGMSKHDAMMFLYACAKEQ